MSDDEGELARLDRLEIELRSLTGVVAVGFDDRGDVVVVQVLLSADVGGMSSRDRIRRLTRATLQRPLVLEIVVAQAQPRSAADGHSSWNASLTSS